MIIELHAIQNFAPANLNRDEQGAPKTVDFGGFTRGRVSSQSWKRAMRRYFAANESSLVSGVRTQRAVSLVADRIVARDASIDRTTAEHRAEAILISDPLKLKVEQIGEAEDRIAATKQLIFLRETDCDGLAQIAIEFPELLDDQIKVTGSGDDKKTEIKPVKFPKDVIKRVQSLFTTPDKAADVALFGRMIAEMPEGNIDAACQVAHAIGTNPVEKEIDYFTAVDDLRPESTEGASMVGEIEFNSSCFYRYAALDVKQLAGNLGADVDDEDVRSVVLAFVKAFALAVPTGKQNSFAAHNPPSSMLVVKREKGCWNLSNAFVDPVVARQGDSLPSRSTTLMLEELTRLGAAYGDFTGGATAAFFSIDGVSAPTDPSLDIAPVNGLSELAQFAGE